MDTEKKITLSAQDIEQIFENHGVRPSPVRTMIYRTLASANRPISVQDMEISLETVDRSSITRAMSTFQKGSLVHAISDGSGTVKYEVCHSDHKEQLSDEHVHFRCEKCNRTLCLHSLPIPEVKLPEGFSMKKATFVISGICNRCQSGISNEE